MSAMQGHWRTASMQTIAGMAEFPLVGTLGFNGQRKKDYDYRKRYDRCSNATHCSPFFRS